MKVCGIVAEYNPFHNGHLYQLEEARKRTNADILIVVMSGNFLQRGEPAIVDKWTRAQMALSGGVDLVVELPVAFSTQAADYFASGAIQILNALNIDVICFGAESGGNEDFVHAGIQFVEKEEEINEAFQSINLDDKPYAAKMQKAIELVIPDFPIDLSKPNNQLGFAYARAIAKITDKISVEVISREKTEYLEETLDDTINIGSATAIRNALFKSEEVFKYVPDYTNELLNQEILINWEAYWPLLKYQLTVSSLKDLQNIYQIDDGLENRFKKNSQAAENFEDFILKMKTRKYTRTRLQRLCVYILLQVTKEQMTKEMLQPKAIHLLGFSNKGQYYLRKKKNKINLPIISNMTQKNMNVWSLDVLSGEIYRLAEETKIKKQDFTRNPLKNIDIKSSH